MIKLTAIAAAAAIAVPLGVTIGSQTATTSGIQAIGEQRAWFHHPRIRGANLDVRFMPHMRSSARQVAERFCRNRGYNHVSDLVLRPSTVTRTVADQSWHTSRGEMRQTYSMIECSSQPQAVVSAY